MTTPQDVQQFIGRVAVDSEGSKTGRVYFDDQTGQLLWVTVATGMFGIRQSFAPVYGSRFDGDQVMLAVSKDLIKDAPSIDDDGQIDASEHDAFYQHYAGYLGAGQAGGQAGYAGSGKAGETAGTAPGRPGALPRGKCDVFPRPVSNPVNGTGHYCPGTVS